MKRIATACAVLMLAACQQGPGAPKPYTGKLRIDAGTEYEMVEAPSPIGGACSGWNTVSIQHPGDRASGITNVICWHRDGDTITITDARDAHRQSSPAAVLTD